MEIENFAAALALGLMVALVAMMAEINDDCCVGNEAVDVGGGGDGDGEAARVA
jgi:hypothetical protein